MIRGVSLDIEQHDDLRQYLVDRGHARPGEALTITNLTGGVSNRTVLVSRAGGADMVIKQALAKLRVKVDWFSDPARVHREAEGLRALETLVPAGAVPTFAFEDHEHHLFAMEAVPQPLENYKSILLRGEVDLALVEQFARLLAMIHAGSAGRSDEMKQRFGDRSFFESLRLEPYFGFAAEQTPAAAPFLHTLMAATRQRAICLVHGDYSPKNILVRPDASPVNLVLLDHEVIHFGDPSFDVGFAMTHLLSKAHHLRAHRTMFSEAARRFWQVYFDACSGLVGDLEAHCVHQTLGCLLARVRGRSPLEYLDVDERDRQRDAVVALMEHVPQGMEELIDQFISGFAQ